MKETILIASDHGGFDLKSELAIFLAEQGYRVKDLGPYSCDRCDYPVTAAALAELISGRRYKKGILICKSGIGNSIVANRFPGVRAALCHNSIIAGLSREHNDSNVLVLGASFVSNRKAREIVSVWLKTPFAGGRHKARLALLRRIEKKISEDKK